MLGMISHIGYCNSSLQGELSWSTTPAVNVFVVNVSISRYHIKPIALCSNWGATSPITFKYHLFETFADDKNIYCPIFPSFFPLVYLTDVFPVVVSPFSATTTNTAIKGQKTKSALKLFSRNGHYLALNAIWAASIMMSTNSQITTYEAKSIAISIVRLSTPCHTKKILLNLIRDMGYNS